MEPASIHIAHRIESETPDGSASESTVGVMSGACPPTFMAGDNAVVTTGSPGKVASADDYYPYGMIMEGRSFNYGQADARYKFTSKERDTETGLDYFGARYYDARIGRWFCIDPLAEKYPGWSSYSYAICNPILFIDPNGETVDLSAIRNWDNRNGTSYLALILADLNAQTGLNLSVGVDGTLEYEKDEDGNAVVSLDEEGNAQGSSGARELIVGAIGSSETARAFINPKASQGGGLAFGLSPRQIENYVSGTSADLNNKTLGWGMSFMHELSHTKVGGEFSDSPKAWGVPGGVEDRLNIIRSELGSDYGQRLSYASRNIGGTHYIPFAPVSLWLLSDNQPIHSYVIRYTPESKK